MAKEAVAGRVKTRLARDVGLGTATRFTRQGTASLLQRLARDARWQSYLAVTPDAGTASRCWPDHVIRVAQGAGDLGQRIQRLMQLAPPGPALLVGTDIPGITAAHVALAFRLLGSHDAVFGPARDGGYWLVGLKRRPRLLRPFQRVRWSTPHALSDTLANLEGKAVAFVGTLGDVDDGPALRAVAKGVGRRVLPVTWRFSPSPGEPS
jgi:uncharacterized protein